MYPFFRRVGAGVTSKFVKIKFSPNFVKIYKILLSLVLSFKDCVFSNALVDENLESSTTMGSAAV